MPLHLVKLCVGVDSLEDLQTRFANRLHLLKQAGEPLELMHTTRMVPKKQNELLAGGSIYWVIKGNIQARQKLLDIRIFQDEENITRCHLILSHDLVPTEWHLRRPFQGWRYLKAEDAPIDSRFKIGAEDNPSPEMLRELHRLGLI